MRFGERIVDLQRAPGSRFRLWVRLLRCTHGKERDHDVGIGEPNIRQSITRIFFYCLIEIVDALLQRFASAFVPVEAAFEVKLIGFGARGVQIADAALLGAGKLDPQVARDFPPRPSDLGQSEF